MNVKKCLMVLVTAFLSVGPSGMALSQVIPLATSPLMASNSSAVKPNLLFVLDESGSMDWDYLPDWLNYHSSNDWTVTAALKNGNGIGQYCKSTGAVGTLAATTLCCRGSTNSVAQCLDVTGNNTPTAKRGEAPFTNNDFNGVYYNPTITYAPPLKYDGTPYTSYSTYTAVPVDGFGVQNAYTMNLTSNYPDLEYCTDGTYANCLRNDNYQLPGTVFGSNYTTAHMTDVSHANNAASTTADFVGGTLAAPTITSRALGPYYYITIPGEYCTTKKLTNCTASTVPTTVAGTSYIYPAKLRWCSDAARNTCQALRTSTYQYPRYPTWVLGAYGYAKASITSAVAQNASFTISSITAGGTELLAGSIICSNVSATCNTSSATASVRNHNVALAIQVAVAANAAATQFGADANGTVVTLSAPAGTAYNAAVLRINTAASPSPAGVTFANFNSSGSAAGSSVGGSFRRIDIVSGQTYGNLWVDNAGIVYTSAGTGRTLILDRSTRTDCTASSCSYAQEMTNFANWYAYYHTRMQMMKTSLSRAFSSLPNNKYRVGFFTINSSAFGNTTIAKSITGSSPNRYSSNNFLDIALWDDTQKEYWYNTMLKANPTGGTPLRQALSRAGLIYAHMLKGASDPVEESCQQNFTILSTDGYWNGNGGSRVTGGTPAAPTTTSMNDQDGAAPAWKCLSDAFPSRPCLDGNATADTLADAAAFYYNNDLRKSAWGNCTSGVSGHDVCTDDVPTTKYDPNNTQHMMTFTIGLGLNGVMQYRENYNSPPGAGDTPDDFDSVKTGSAAGSGACLWQTAGTGCNWPTPDDDRQENIDDLWHAAVNGHGVYYSAKNPAELAAGLSGALATVNISTGSAAAATTSSPNISRNDNFALSTTYTTVEWSGDLFMQTIDINTGALSSGKVWSAQAPLDGVNATTRNVWMYTSETGSYPGKVKPFKWANMTANSAYSCGNANNEQDCFGAANIATLSQFCSSGTDCLSTADKATAAGQNLVNYLRGDKTYQSVVASVTSNSLYRVRAHTLGDIVNSEAVYVQNSPFAWDETANPGYTAFMQGNYTRAGSVYVAANDGMLHAFDAANGTERWAYVPSMVLPSLYKLADTNYSHQYFVDGTPAVGDADAGGWKTLLVGGLNGGGRGYYALDITDPATPKGLWEFKVRTSGCAATPAAAVGSYDDCDLGYSYGSPIITKYCTSWTGVTSISADGTPLNGTCSAYTWAVLVTSGYNNVSPGDGKGYLYVLSAATGQILQKLSTGTGNSAAGVYPNGPSNLSRVNVWANNGAQDNAATTAYAGDMQGNLWRFNLANGSVSKLASVGATKPITVKPAIGFIGNQYRVISVPTGRLLSNTVPYDDLNIATTQSVYGIWDKNDGSTWSPPTNFIAAPITCTSSGSSLSDCTATTTASVFNGTNGGWYFNFTGAGERGYTDPDVVFGTLIFSSGSPLGSACSPSGSGRVWSLDLASGSAPKGATKVATSVPYMPPRPVAVSIGGKIEIIEGNAGGTGASAYGGSSGLQIGNPVLGWGQACLAAGCSQTPRHAIWRILPD